MQKKFLKSTLSFLFCVGVLHARVEVASQNVEFINNDVRAEKSALAESAKEVFEKRAQAALNSNSSEGLRIRPYMTYRGPVTFPSVLWQVELDLFGTSNEIALTPIQLAQARMFAVLAYLAPIFDSGQWDLQAPVGLKLDGNYSTTVTASDSTQPFLVSTGAFYQDYASLFSKFLTSDSSYVNALSNSIVTLNTKEIFDSNAIVTVAAKELADSWAIAALAAGGGAGLQTQITDNSNAIVTLAAKRVFDSNAIVTVVAKELADSWAIAALNDKELADSAAIINLSNGLYKTVYGTGIYDPGATLEYDISLWTDRILKFDTLSYGSTILGLNHKITIPQLLGTSLISATAAITFQNVYFNGAYNGFIDPSGGTVVFGDATEVALTANVNLTETWNFGGNVTINGNGNELNFAGGSLFLKSGCVLTIKNASLNSILAASITTEDSTPTLILENVKWHQNDNISWSGSSLSINDKVEFLGTGSFVFNGSSIQTGESAYWRINKSIEMSHFANVTYSNKGTIELAGASLNPNGNTITFKRGNVIVSDRSFVTGTGAIAFGDGISAVNDVSLTFRPGAQFFFTAGGTLNNQNVTLTLSPDYLAVYWQNAHDQLLAANPSLTNDINITSSLNAALAWSIAEHSPLTYLTPLSPLSSVVVDMTTKMVNDSQCVLTMSQGITNNSNAIVTVAAKELADSWAIATLTDHRLVDSNAIVTLNAKEIVDSNAIVTVAAKELADSWAIATLTDHRLVDSNAIVTLNAKEIVDSNAIVTVATKELADSWAIATLTDHRLVDSNAIVTLNAKEIVDSNAIVTVVAKQLADSWAIATLTDHRLADSNAIVTVVAKELADSNAIVALDVKVSSFSDSIVTLANRVATFSDSIVTLDSRINRIDYGAVTFTPDNPMLFSADLGDARNINFTTNTVLDGAHHTILCGQSSSAVITLDPTISVTFENVMCEGAYSGFVQRNSGATATFGSGTELSLRTDVTLTESWAFSGNVTLNGNNNTLTFGSNGRLQVAPNSSLLIKNIKLENMADGALVLLDTTASVSLVDVVWAQDGNYSFNTGSLSIGNKTVFTGVGDFAYKTTKTSIINSNATWLLDRGITFTYAPSTYTNNQLISFADATAKMEFHGASLNVSIAGLAFTKGTVVVSDHSVITSDATNDSQAVTFGDGVYDDNINLVFVGNSKFMPQTGRVRFLNVLGGSLSMPLSGP